MWKEKVFIERKNVKNLNIRIRDGKILVSAPLNISEEYIMKALETKEDWIKEKLLKKREEKIIDLLNREVINNGDVIPFLGNEYTIEIIEKSNGGVIIQNDKIIINCYKSKNAIELLKKFYREKMNSIFVDIFEKMQENTGLYANKLTIKFMKTRWGSCNKNKKYINLNGELISKRYKAIEYVILHELCHLIHANHSRDFYNLVEKFMPDYRDEEIYLNGK